MELAARVVGPEIGIATECDPSVPRAFADPSRLESALLNLVVNARDAMPGGGKLTLSTCVTSLESSYPAVKTGELEPGDYVSISVSDTGQGMSRETMERAFDPFFYDQAAGQGNRPWPGDGLRLREAVRRNGADLQRARLRHHGFAVFAHGGDFRGQRTSQSRDEYT